MTYKLRHGGQVVRLALTDIVVGPRLRQVSEAQVQNLLLMAEDTGITSPIHVRWVAGRHVLIDGAHRLEVAKRLGHPDIAALVRKCRQDEARVMEASNNLGAARMSPLQTAVFVASWKRDYYALHPERKPGVFKGNRHTGKLVTELSSVTRSIADAFAVTERQIHKVLSVADSLVPDEIARLDTAVRKVTLRDLQDLAKITEPGERQAVIDAVADGKGMKVSAARRQWAETTGTAKPKPSAGDEALSALLGAWSRASKKARLGFLAKRGAEIDRLRGGAE